jgi:hypothetical protein
MLPRLHTILLHMMRWANRKFGQLRSHTLDNDTGKCRSSTGLLCMHMANKAMLIAPTQRMPPLSGQHAQGSDGHRFDNATAAGRVFRWGPALVFLQSGTWESVWRMLMTSGFTGPPTNSGCSPKTSTTSAHRRHSQGTL